MKIHQTLRCILSFVALFALQPLMSTSAAPPAWEKLLGQRPAEWRLEHWLNSKPLKLEGLRGKVVLVRWWTAPQCPYCGATAPALNEFSKAYAERGLEVIGIYHHKSGAPLKTDDVRRYADKFGFEFPVAIDPDWGTLKQWWLDEGAGDWTSVSFLLDREGRIRHIHPGGQYVKGDSDYSQMDAEIRELLRQQ